MKELTIFPKRCVLDIWEGCEYAYVIYDINSVFAYWTNWKEKHTNKRMTFFLKGFLQMNTVYLLR